MQKIIILISIFSALVFTGCKKDNPIVVTPPAFQSYIKFKLDNAETACNSQIVARYYPFIPDTAILISGSWANGAIEIYVSGDQQLLTPGTYTFNSTKWHSGTIWTISPPVGYVAGMVHSNSTYSGSGYVTITEISTQYVKGSFAFITGIDIPANTFKTVTSGEFYVKRST